MSSLVLPHLNITRPVPRRSQDDVLNGINVANLERSYSLSLAWKSPAYVVDLSQFHASTVGRNVFPATILLCKLSLLPFTQLSSPRGALKRTLKGKRKKKRARERVTLRALIGGKESVRRGGGDERVGHASIHPRECHVYMHNAGDRGNAFTTSAVEELCYCLKRAVSQWYTGAREKKRNDWRRRTEMGRRGE